ncbi:hypothetical protein [Amycolatopsis magusensis]|uniref:hypothetical protein n=1 Tax=Amycolatopsis magusensis TaxID=882444 RepID=UPI0024A9CE62|nr:hypothetical protein [Amycolatopsis magusensis]MDI5979902.1 hypothetical protein [Amycolatopsis magusensis]
MSAVAAGAAAIGAHALHYGHWIADDAGITFAYARSIDDGHGPVLQPDADEVEGYSNPAWLFLHVLGRALGLFDRGNLLGIPDYVLFPKAVAWLCCLGTLIACAVAARRVFRRAWLPTAGVGLALAANPSYVIWCFSGLENSLFAMTVCWLAVLLFVAALDGRLLTGRVACWAGALAAVAMLTRPDGAIYVLAYPLVLAICARSAPPGARFWAALLSCRVFALPVVVYLAWRLTVFGEWLPNTATAKVQDFPELGDLLRIGELVEYAGLPVTLAAGLLLVHALIRGTSWQRGLFVLLVMLSLGLTAFVVLEGDWMALLRFATPIWVVATIAVVFLLAELARVLSRRQVVAMSAIGVLVVAHTASGFVTAATSFARFPTVPLCYVASRFGLTVNTYAGIIGAEHATFLAPDLGGTALTSRLELIDMAGLAHEEVAGRIAAADMAGLRDDVFERWKPTFIHSRGDWAMGNGITSDPRMNRDYHFVFDYRDPILPNGDWVRKDSVPSAAALAVLRRYAGEVVVERDAWQRQRPLAACGPRLRPGVTETFTPVPP